MLAIKSTAQVWRDMIDAGADVVLLGQLDNNIVVLEVSEIPQYDCEEYEGEFTQRVFAGKYGTEMTYTELVHIRNLLEGLGNDAEGASSLSDLEYRKKQRDYITALELALVDLYEGSL